MTTEEFEAIATDWMATARHPHFNRRYNELVCRGLTERWSSVPLRPAHRHVAVSK
jgi:hypothetical protein